ncbi:hypothetical protein GJR96_08650 [Haloferax sp. MBLA0076]|uniref:DoxX family membrane protein n=1 Tax=Haloferax litoreum TaxID=2666140 RepID=A0A6A8GF56_9EURY|nr:MULTISPECIES: hypothetical protein [Haloferax]KAB1193509.1 hypothetical protein Hfx1148_08635 [Haloferax sp. CBA1148]MRX22024.1 hypothetical protein [Haloferax litoreum]
MTVGVRLLLGLTYVGGALVHVYLGLRAPDVYGEITQYIVFDTYRTLWSGIVLPNLDGLLAILVVFEALLGVTLLRGGSDARVSLLVGAAFQLALAPLGFWWATNVALALVHVGVFVAGAPEDSPTRVRLAEWRREWLQ